MQRRVLVVPIVPEMRGSESRCVRPQVPIRSSPQPTRQQCQEPDAHFCPCNHTTLEPLSTRVKVKARTQRQRGVTAKRRHAWRRQVGDPHAGGLGPHGRVLQVGKRSILASTRCTSTSSSPVRVISRASRRNRCAAKVRTCSVITHPSPAETGTR